MIGLLAQTRTGQGAADALLRLLDYVRQLDFPSRSQYVEDLLGLSQLGAVALVLGGVGLLVMGFKYFKFFVVANAAGIGALLGIYFGSLSNAANMPLWLGLAGAVLCGAVALPAIKAAVCLMGALAGGLLGYGLWDVVANVLARPGLLQHAWVGGVFGMIAVGMLAWVGFSATVMIFTAVQGGLMLVTGLCSLLLRYPSIAEGLEPHIVDNTYLLNLLIGVPAALGFCYQYSKEAGRIHKKRKATEKSPV